MGEALKQAQMAFDRGEVPVGAVVVAEKRIIARAYNQTEQLNDVTAHAEMLAMTSAFNYLGAKYLKEFVCYVRALCNVCRSPILGATRQIGVRS